MESRMCLKSARPFYSDMKPLSIKKRRFYLITLILLFSIFIPLIILYATGYRFTDTLNLTRTGGIFVSVPESGADAYINNSIVEQTGIFQRNVFVQDLKPGLYDFKIKKNGFQSWSKQLQVFPKTVTVAHPFLLPEEPTLVEIPIFENDGEVQISATSTTAPSSMKLAPQKQNPEYKKILALFATTTSPNPKRKLLVKNVRGVLHVSWTGSTESIPYYFCVSEICQKEVLVKPSSKLRSFEFYPGRDDLLILNLADGIYLTEIDDRSTQNIQTLVQGKNLDFRVDDGIIYIKKNKNIYYLSL